jgi:hypothetical protein
MFKLQQKDSNIMLVKKRRHSAKNPDPKHVIQNKLKLCLRDALKKEGYIYFHDLPQLSGMQDMFSRDMALTTLLQRIGKFNIHPTYKGGYAVVTVVIIFHIKQNVNSTNVFCFEFAGCKVRF